MLVKGGRYVDPAEAEWTRLARELTDLPVPEVYHVCKWGRETHIYLELLPGSRSASFMLSHKPANDAVRVRFTSDLHSIVQKLSAVKAPAGALVGGFGGKNLDAFSDFWEEGSKAPAPLTSSEAFNAWLKAEFIAGPGHSQTTWETEVEPLLDPNAPLVLVHGHLNEYTLLMDDDGRITGITDWDLAGWYPEWMPLYQAMGQRYGAGMMKTVAREMVGFEEELEKYKALRHVGEAVELW
ncbi:hypothetical protein JCM6882_002732 [Rhodosporidiobolus microsporus]